MAQVHLNNLSPLIGQLPSVSLPTTARSANSKTQYTLHIETANYMNTQQDGALSYVIDGETTTANQSFAYRINTFWVGASLDFMLHGGGYLDNAIYNFHEAFGMPQSGRQKSTNNQLAWEVNNNGTDVYSTQKSTSGLSKSSIYIESSLLSTPNQHWRAELHLPTGNTEKRLGSDTTALSLSTSQMYDAGFADTSFMPTIDTWLGAGVLWQHSDNQAIQELGLRSTVLSAEAGLSYALAEQYSVIGQLNSNSPYFDTDIRELGWTPVVLSAALRFKHKQENIKLGFREDIRPSTSPDFSIFLSLTTNL